MKKRFLSHLFNFLILLFFIFLAAAIYRFPVDRSFGETLKIIWGFILSRKFNLLLIAILTYFFIYLTGLSEYRRSQKSQQLTTYLVGLFKLVLILGMVSFIEFYLLFETKIGRLIYLYIFIFYAVYYYILLYVPRHWFRQKLLWAAGIPAEDFLKKYAHDPRMYELESLDMTSGEMSQNVRVVYRQGEVSESFSQFLIRHKLQGTRVIELIDLVEADAEKIPLDYVNIDWLLDKLNVAQRNYMRISRAMNVSLSLVLLILFFLPGFLIALIHRLFSKGPIFFIQPRVGMNEKEFKLIKFRTMRQDAEKDGARFAEENDPRITPIGGIMRQLRIDEIPQLINVIKNDMDLVGPRPERKIFVEELAREIPYYRLRFLVKPGLTGWAQVKGEYAGHDIEDHKGKLEYDLFYIKNRSIALDLLILLKTARTIFQAKGK
jgi:lipopolysaccharide/colanic/teichoic acid biosynthesis glycosyltransferase